ncbi:E3 ubiquitin-protein ligase ATL4-like [Aristolochia californica]|uniref:E3 ubiquitin-protein ligase ATL4-like n=1 Tax=Aristolochia californica TaxID=171875 RepID=UPI0035DA75E2
MSNRGLGIATQVMVMAIVISVVLLFVGVGLLILVHVCMVGRAFTRSLSTNNQRGNESKPSDGISQDDLEKLPCFRFKGLAKGSSPIDCAVCLENFQSGDQCRMLPLCKHSFHAQCVDSWLLKTPICPMCRTGANGSGKEMEMEGCSHIGGARFEPTGDVVVGIPLSTTASPMSVPE